MDPTALSKIESGETELTAARREPLARVLKVPEWELLTPIGWPIPENAVAVPVETRPHEPAHGLPEVVARLRAILDLYRISPAMLAVALACSELEVDDWLQERQMPPWPLLSRLATRTGVTLRYIYFGDEDGLYPGVAARLRKRIR